MDGETYTSTQEELEAERAYWAMEDARHDYAAWVDSQMNELESFEAWSLTDLVEELETVRTLTPDQDEIIYELVREIERRRAA